MHEKCIVVPRYINFLKIRIVGYDFLSQFFKKSKVSC